ncbi:MAG: ATP-binding protein [candidate division NC10 bacterium]|nr:ATP-binding protein [candidate division NC10 bacterium]
MSPSRVIPLRIANLGKGLRYLGQVYGDPRDALNEFVSNAADEYGQTGPPGRTIRITLRRSGHRPRIVVSDDGRGLTRSRLEAVAGHLCESEKAALQGGDQIVGEKGIGILAFAAFAEHCDIVTRAEEEPTTHRMHLRRGAEVCEIGDEVERRRPRPGTDVYLTGIGKEIWRVFTIPKLADYFRLRRRRALLAGEYTIEIVEGHKTLPVRPEVYKGNPFEAAPVRTPFGPIRIHLFLWPTASADRHVALVGKGGTTIVDDVATLDEFAHHPWNAGQIQGEVIFPALEQTTGRKGVVRDAGRFPLLERTLQELEVALTAELKRLAEEHRERSDRELFLRLREIFKHVLRDLDDLENPLRAPVTDPEGEIGPGGPGQDPISGGERPRDGSGRGAGPTPGVEPEACAVIRQRHRPAPAWRLLPFSEERRHLRSDFDADSRAILVNELHPDYRSVREDEIAQIHYLMALTAKELALWQNPRSDAPAVAEDMIRILVRARRYLPAKG